MKLVMLSNYFNHHQKPLGDALDRATGGGFTFVATEPMTEERRRMGWGMDDQPAYVLDVSRAPAALQQAKELVLQADAVIWGAAPLSFVKERLKQGKLTFRNTERIFKKGFSAKEYLPRAVKHRLLNQPCREQYLLCSSAYAASDYARLGLYKGRAFKWGYFPPLRRYDGEQLSARKQENERPLLLWAGRLLALKHPELALQAAEQLKQRGIAFDLKIIGDGPLRGALETMIEQKDLHSCTELLGTMSPEQVRDWMERADVFLFTSDQNEGWGAVLNESMNSGCAVVADAAIGSVPYLLRDGENGLSYTTPACLPELTAALLTDAARREMLGRAACRTVTELWNADTAAARLLELTAALLAGQQPPAFADGPCSRA